MVRQYKFTAARADKFNKHGIHLTVYHEGVKGANMVRVSVKKGHFQEFYEIKSWFIYYIIKGQGTFFLNGQKVKTKATDLIVIPPKTRIYYFGKMEMVLTVTPAFNEKNERHVRMVDKSENPYYKKK